MESGITSKRSAVYYTSLLFACILTLVGGLMIAFYFYKLIFGKYESKLVLLFFCGAVFIGLFTYAIYLQLNRVPTFYITKDTLTVKGKKYAIADIVSISFSGKKDFGSINKIEGMQVTFKGNRIFYIYDQYYSNIAEIKRFLNSAWQQDIPTTPKAEIKHVSDRTYLGGPIGGTTILIFFFAGLSAFFLLFVEEVKIMALFFLIFPLLFAFLHCYYYAIIDNNLEIKMFALPGYKKTYPLKDIKEVVFESGHKKPNGLRIIKTDYSTSKLYFAATLYDKHWRELRAHIEEAGIIVRDEIGITRQN